MSDNEGEEVEVKKKSKGTKRKAKKAGPKRALSAYMFFCQDKRKQVTDENAGIAFSEVGKLLGEMWGKLDDEAKVPYAEQNKKDKERYEAEKADFPEPADDDEDDGGSKKKKAKTGKAKKDPNAPKNAKTAYMRFCQDERKRLKESSPNLTFSEVGKQMGENWKALSDSEKKPYNDAYQKEKKSVDAAKAKYNAAKGDDGGKKAKKPKKAKAEEEDADAEDAAPEEAADEDAADE